MVERLEEIVLPIAAWAAWAPGLESASAWSAWATTAYTPAAGNESPSLPFVDPLIRRRLSRAARMALHVAHACTENPAGVRTVFASRHGELHRTVGMLHDLGRGEGISPTDFSLSVHNATAGIYSIVQRDRSPSIAVAAGEESFGYGLLEAASQWCLDNTRAVLLVYADEPAPAEYRGFIRGEERPHALGLLLSAGADTLVRMRRTSAPVDVSTPEMQSLTFIRAWIKRESAVTWNGRGCLWSWGFASNVG